MDSNIEAREGILKKISLRVNQQTGSKNSLQNQSLARAQVSKRATELGLDIFEYNNYFNENSTVEIEALISQLTVHHTFFFREYGQFLKLEKELPAIVEKVLANNEMTLKFWCAAASTGEEVYSLALFLEHHLPLINKNVGYTIIGTDICKKSIQKASNGVYRWGEISKIPDTYKRNFWKRGTGNISGFAKIDDKIKEKCIFKQLNLVSESFEQEVGIVHHIFCRNVFIYFEHEIIQKVITKFSKVLTKDSFLYIGVSENLTGIEGDFKHMGSSIFQFNRTKENIKIPDVQDKVALKRVFCVDDSPVIHKLLEKILTKDDGFQIVGSAMNGEEAEKYISKNYDKIDLITLDIEMPKMDGPTFLGRHYKKEYPPIVMLSSLNRDTEKSVKICLDSGASDYVRKPSLENIEESSGEIRFKLETIFRKNKGTKKTYAKEVAKGKKKVLIVDDSAVIRKFIKKMIGSNNSYEVIAETGDPKEVRSLIGRHRPDLMILDLMMPGMNGVEVLKQLGSTYFIPTLVFSSLGKGEGDLVLEALGSGAIDYLRKPNLKLDLNFEQEFYAKLGLVSAFTKKKKEKLKRKSKKAVSVNKFDVEKSIIAIGSSTGGTEALKEVFTHLPDSIPTIVVAQHIPEYFSKALAERLDALCKFKVKEAENGETLEPNCIYIAPGGKQMEIINKTNKYKVQITEDFSARGFKPSVNKLFSSVAKLKNCDVTGIILTGMGKDGTNGLRDILAEGGSSIVQDEESCVVFGMPKTAIVEGFAQKVVPLSDMAQEIMNTAQSKYYKKSS